MKVSPGLVQDQGMYSQTSRLLQWLPIAVLRKYHFHSGSRAMFLGRYASTMRNIVFSRS
jgi:hypothetical protein